MEGSSSCGFDCAADSKSRKEKRKEARSGNNKQKHQSRLQHQESQRKRKLGDRKSNEGNGIKKKNSQTRFLEQNEIVQQASEHSNKANMVKGEEKGFKRTSKTKFEEYLEMEMPNAGMLAEQDIELERKLARKLKVKGGKLGGVDDGLDMLFEDDKYALESWTEGFPDDEDLLDPSSKKNKKKKIVEQVSEDEIGDDSSFAALDLEEDARMSSEDIPAKAQARKRRRKRKSLQQKQEGDMAGETACSGSQPAERHSEEVAVNGASAKAPEMDGNVKYVAPHLRSRAGNESEEHTQIRRRVRGLLNRLSESNVESITAEIASIFRAPQVNEESQQHSPLAAVSAQRLSVKRCWYPVIMVLEAMNS
ncbi:putative sgd1p [Corchorus olitorius]|uniref:Sgd1p n=1 Tax=Corchorus olitorius TaxID=93759 RepID=A0A1R3HJ92_9ROSI|nr:putative sgd1p [Corchorus olitorius]